MKLVYNEDYYKEYLTGDGKVAYETSDDIKEFMKTVAKKIVEKYNPKTVLDAGCAMGFLVEALRNEKVEAYGIDISEYAISKAPKGVKQYCFAGSLAEPLPKELQQHYDLIVSVEVLEHLEEAQGLKAIENLCKYTNNILFSSSPNDFDDITHVNVQQAEYWAKKFAQYNFYNRVDTDNTFLTSWTMLFTKEEDFIKVVETYERTKRVNESNILKKSNLANQELEKNYLDIENLNTIIKDKEKAIVNIEVQNKLLDANLTKLGKDIENLNTIIGNKDKEISDLRETNGTKDKSIAKLSNDIENLNTIIKNKEQEIETLTTSNDKNSKQIKLLAYQVETLKKDNARLEQDEFKTHYLAAMDQKNSLEQELLQIQQAFNELLNSTSWKSTEPLRNIA